MITSHGYLSNKQTPHFRMGNICCLLVTIGFIDAKKFMGQTRSYICLQLIQLSYFYSSYFPCGMVFLE